MAGTVSLGYELAKRRDASGYLVLCVAGKLRWTRTRLADYITRIAPPSFTVVSDTAILMTKLLVRPSPASDPQNRGRRSTEQPEGRSDHGDHDDPDGEPY